MWQQVDTYLWSERSPSYLLLRVRRFFFMKRSLVKKLSTVANLAADTGDRMSMADEVKIGLPYKVEMPCHEEDTMGKSIKRASANKTTTYQQKRPPTTICLLYLFVSG